MTTTVTALGYPARVLSNKLTLSPGLIIPARPTVITRHEENTVSLPQCLGILGYDLVGTDLA